LLLGALRLSAFLGARRKLKQHLARQAELERRVEERTIELQHKSQLLAEQAEQLKALDRLKTQFFVNVGHEFRTPLTLVLGPLDDVLDDPRAKVTDKLRNLLELARRNAKRVLQLIIELLDVNRLEHGQMPLRYASYCCQDFLNQHLPSWRAWCERYGHTLILEAQSEPREAAFDAAQLERAIGNLLSNACKYTPHGGTIRLQSDAPSGYWRISVRDSGPGIEPNALPYVFDRFFQTTPEHRTEGSGIGLNLVREIAERHGGQATVESELGVGCIFRVWIPLAGAPAPAISEPDTEPLPAANGERPVVLVVDDHDDMRARLRQLCEARYQVIEAHDGPSALMRASTELPDAVISDVMMPGFDGVDFVKRMRANPSTESIPILLLTAKVGSEHARVGLDAGANDYLAKPFDSSELLARIGAMLQFCRRLKQRLATSVALSPEPQGREEQWLRRFNHLLQKSLPEPSFSIEQLSDALHMDRSTLFRRIKEEYGMSPTEYLREQRLLRARELLSQQQGGVLEVSLAVGYENHSNFARAFKQRFGHPPSDLLLKRRRES
jgi:signal transduction histidine kinase/DNA-binding response OmpR family regulator